MQGPDGQIKGLVDIFTKDQLDRMGGPEQQLANLKQKALGLEQETGKPHPVFEVGEVVEVKGGKFRVHQIKGRKRLVLKPVKY
jgi:hypothetical protein